MHNVSDKWSLHGNWFFSSSARIENINQIYETYFSAVMGGCFPKQCVWYQNIVAFYNYHVQTVYFWGKNNNSKCMESIEIGNLKYEFCIADFISALGKFVIRKTDCRL